MQKDSILQSQNVMTEKDLLDLGFERAKEIGKQNEKNILNK